MLYKLYKPFGMLSQLTSGEERQLRKKRFLSELYDFEKGIMPVGRLDEKSEGLLLMTNDGKLSNYINTSGLEKEYWVQLNGKITDRALNDLSKGVSIGLAGKTYTTKPCIARLLKLPPFLPEPDKALRIGKHVHTSWISITITEGKFRQVRKMTAAVGFPTLRLVRIRIDKITLGTLLPGEVKTTSIPKDLGI